MKTFLVVEGHGEVSALPVIIRRVAAWRNVTLKLAGHPFREPRNRLLQKEHLHRALEAARRQADAALVVFDADDECAVELAQAVLDVSHEVALGFPVFPVVAVREFEAWFLAAAVSLRGKRGLADDLTRPEQHDLVRDAKGWLSAHKRSPYSPAVDQVALAAEMSLDEAHQHSRSFRRFVKVVVELANTPTK